VSTGVNSVWFVLARPVDLNLATSFLLARAASDALNGIKSFPVEV
jgi:hypothetical protein